MKLHSLIKITSRSKKRFGRGYGSGKGGHTSSRGTKGQKSRNSIPLWFEGGQLPQIRRFPFIKGKSRFKSLKNKTMEINLDALNVFSKDEIVNPETLVGKGIISQKESLTNPIKILGNGQINIPLTVKLPTSESAKSKIEKAGGKVENAQNK